MNYYLSVLVNNHKPEIIKWALAQCLAHPKNAQQVVEAIQPNRNLRAPVLDGLRMLAKTKPHLWPKELQ